MLISGGVAQLGERRLCKPEVVGSIPFASTNIECEAFDGKFRTHRSTPAGFCVIECFAFAVSKRREAARFRPSPLEPSTTAIQTLDSAYTMCVM